MYVHAYQKRRDNSENCLRNAAYFTHIKVDMSVTETETFFRRINPRLPPTRLLASDDMIEVEAADFEDIFALTLKSS